MNRLALLLAAVGSIMLTACDSPTAPTREPSYFPYAGCVMIQAGITNLPDGRLDDVWQQWHCEDMRNWQVRGDGFVFRIGTTTTASGKTYIDDGRP